MKINIAGNALTGLLQTARTVVPRLAAAHIVQESAGTEGTPVRRITHRAAAEAEALARPSSVCPNPTFTVRHETLNAAGPSPSESCITLDKRVDWPGARNARRTAASERTAARIRRPADSAMLAIQVRSACVRAARSERRACTLERVVEGFRGVEEGMAARYEDGDVSLNDHRRIGIEWVRHEGSLADAPLTDASGGGQADLVPVAQMAHDTGETESIGLPAAAEALGAAQIAVARVRSELWTSYDDLVRAVGGFGDLVRQVEDEG